jgi:hypothetical protein
MSNRSGLPADSIGADLGRILRSTEDANRSLKAIREKLREFDLDEPRLEAERSKACMERILRRDPANSDAILALAHIVRVIEALSGTRAAG